MLLKKAKAQFYQKKDCNMKISEITLLSSMLFMLVYLAIGNPDDQVWSGLFFLVNYTTLLVLFKDYKNKIIRLGGISLNISILIYIVLKYFLHLEIESYYSFIPFTICLITLLRLEYVLSQRKTL